MAWQLLTVVEATKAGPAALLDLVTASVSWDSATYANGVEFANDGKTILIVSNADAAKTSTQTFQAVADPDGRTESLAPVVANLKTGLMGPFLPLLWNTSAGRIRFIPSQAVEVDIKFVAVRVSSPS